MHPLKRLSHTYTPQGQPGFLGPGHIARSVIQTDFSHSDPFILLMDDILDKKDYSPAGGPHPHVGFETVTLVLEGHFGEGEHQMNAGDFEMMTAGSGIVHTETIAQPTKLRLLQLWLNLPKKARWATPRLQRMNAEFVPTVITPGGRIKVYSGSFAGVTSPVQNYTPFVLSHITLNAGGSLREGIAGKYRTFMYVLNGRVGIGEEGHVVNSGEVVWFELSNEEIEDVQLLALQERVELVMYAAEPQNHSIVSHGPFIADSMDEIKRLYSEYRNGRIAHINDGQDQRITYELMEKIKRHGNRN